VRMTGRRSNIAVVLVLLGHLLAAAEEVRAQAAKPGGVGPTGTSLKVRVGWGKKIQADRWNPVYITLADSQPRNVLLEFRAPRGSFFGMRSRQVVTIGPVAQTFVVYMPLRHFMEGDLSFVVRDPGTRRKYRRISSDLTS
jgi:hypothetical protein